MKFDEKSFFSTVLGSEPHCDYKNCNECISQRVVNLSTIDKIHLKCDVIDGSVLNGIRHPIIFSFFSDKPPCYKVFCQPEAVH